MQNVTAEKPEAKQRRGFATMDKTRQKEIASAGGRTAHARGHAHEFTPEEARNAGRKGGQTVSQNREHMATIGRKGGIAHGKLALAEKEAQPTVISAGATTAATPEFIQPSSMPAPILPPAPPMPVRPPKPRPVPRPTAAPPTMAARQAARRTLISAAAMGQAGIKADRLIGTLTAGGNGK